MNYKTKFLIGFLVFLLIIAVCVIGGLIYGFTPGENVDFDTIHQYELSNPQIRHVFGRLSMVVLNPVDALATLATLDELKCRTQKNCQLRGDSPASAEERTAFADEEAPAWRQMIELGATEYPNWPFPEHVYETGDRKEKLIEARRTLPHQRSISHLFRVGR